jgi:ribosomal protein S18 acetylase RimI-like enzyme
VGAEIDVIRWGAERARTGPWRGDRRVAYLAPLPDAPTPSADFVRRCCRQLAERGFSRVVTGALGPGEQAGFLSAGFEVEERLHLLGHDLRELPPVDPRERTLRRARPGDRPAVLAVDGAAFPPFWRMDEAGLDEALRATPHTRFRVGGDPDIVGYAVTGRAGRRGFLQRLAVEPTRQRAGIGRALVLDGMRWLRRWRVERAVVNTQLENERALALYESLGFRREPTGLTVLSAGLTG